MSIWCLLCICATFAEHTGGYANSRICTGTRHSHQAFASGIRTRHTHQAYAPGMPSGGYTQAYGTGTRRMAQAPGMGIKPALLRAGMGVAVGAFLIACHMLLWYWGPLTSIMHSWTLDHLPASPSGTRLASPRPRMCHCCLHGAVVHTHCIMPVVLASLGRPADSWTCMTQVRCMCSICEALRQRPCTVLK